MSKNQAPRTAKKYRSTLKKQFMGPLKKYATQLEEELRAIRSDPNTMVGKLSQAYEQAMISSKRLSALCATLLKSQGGRVVLKKEELEAFKGLAVNIRWEVPEGVKPEEADSFTFFYDAMTEAELQKQQEEQFKALVAKRASAEAEAAKSGHTVPADQPEGAEWRGLTSEELKAKEDAETEELLAQHPEFAEIQVNGHLVNPEFAGTSDTADPADVLTAIQKAQAEIIESCACVDPNLGETTGPAGYTGPRANGYTGPIDPNTTE